MGGGARVEDGVFPSKPQCLYEILEVPKNASVQDIRINYKKLAKKWHPDRCQEKAEVAKQNFQRISEAYAVLVDPKKREKYDKGELDHNKEPIDIAEFLKEFRTLLVMHGKTFPDWINASLFHNVPGTNIPDFNEIRDMVIAHVDHAQGGQGGGGQGVEAMQVERSSDAEMQVASTDNGAKEPECDYLGAFMADAVEVLGRNWYRCTLCTGPMVPVVVYSCQQQMREHFEQKHVCEFLAFVEEFFPDDNNNSNSCEEFQKLLDGMNVSEIDWKACQMIDQSAKQALPNHRPNGYTHGTHGPGRMQPTVQVPYSLSSTDLAGFDASPPIPLNQRTFGMQRSMPNPPTDRLWPDWMAQSLQEAGGGLHHLGPSPLSSSTFIPSPGIHDMGTGRGFQTGGQFGGYPTGGTAPNGRPPVSGGGQAASSKPPGSSCILSRKWGKR